MGRNSIADLIGDFDRRGEEIAFIYRQGYRTVRWTYSAVAQLAKQFSQELLKRGVKRGDRIVLIGGNSAEWVGAFLGCALYGAVAVPLDRGSTAEFAKRVVEEVDAILAVCSEAFAGFLSDVPVIKFEELSEVLARYPALGAANRPLRDDVLEIIFTSGTTAEPKGIVITHGNVLANLEALELEIEKYSRYERLVHPLRFLDLLPLSHVFGQFLAVYVPQALGAIVVFHDSLNPADVISTIKREKVNVCIAVPHMLSSMKGQIERGFRDEGALRSFREDLERSANSRFWRRWWKFRRIHRDFGWRFWAFISGGSALEEADERFWSQLGFAVIQGYGLTETTSLVSVNHPFKSSRRSIGKMLPGREVKLGPDGEILVRGENVASRYWQKHEMKALSAEDGWLHTGDLGEIDSGGNLFFKGRKKNVIVTPAGMNVHPEDLEHALKLQNGVHDAVVLGVPVGGNAEPCAVLLLKPGASAEAVVEGANHTLAEYQRITHKVEWPESDFPRTPTQKPLIGVIEEYVRSHATSGARGGVEEVLATLAGGQGEDRPAELNLSSMKKVELMAALESKYQVDLSEASFSDANTVQDLDKLVREGTGQAGQHIYPRWPKRWPFTWLRSLSYWLLAYPATVMLAHPRVKGKDNLRGLKGPALIVCNHISMADIAFVLIAMPASMRTKIAPAMQGEMLSAMRIPDAKAPWWRRQLDRFEYLAITALFNVFPLPQRSSLLKSFSFAGENIDEGYSVLVFPEGRRTVDGTMGTFQTGIGMLASRLRVPVIPMRIDGLYEAAKAEMLFVAPGQITVRVGAPVRYEASSAPESITRDLERRVRQL